MDLNDVLPLIWSRLGAEDGPARSPFRLLHAASIDADGAPSVRTIVLREVHAAAHRIRFYTDIRSPKVSDVARHPRIALVGYDHATRTQLRMAGSATLADASVRRQAWEALPAHSLIDYRATVPSGTPVDDPAAALPPSADVDDTAEAADAAAPRSGFTHFCVVDVLLDRLDWLDLSDRDRSTRARFLRDGAQWRGSWVAP